MKKIKSVIALVFATITLCSGALFASCQSSAQTGELPPILSENPLPPTEENEPEKEPEEVLPLTADYIRCTGNSVNIRSGAGTE